MYQYNDTVTYLLFKFSSTDTSYFLSRLLKCSLIAQSKDELQRELVTLGISANTVMIIRQREESSALWLTSNPNPRTNNNFLFQNYTEILILSVHFSIHILLFCYLFFPLSFMFSLQIVSFLFFFTSS